VSRGGELEPAREPLHLDPNAGVGPGMSFAVRVLESGTCERIILVPCAVGGTWIDRWVPGADLYSTAVAEASAAMRHGQLAGVLWHQGEANAVNAESAAAYAAQLECVIAGIRAGLSAPSAPFIAGEIGYFLSGYVGCPEFERINAAIHEVCDRALGCAVVSSDGLGHIGDFLHFDAPAARELGLRYADAWLSMLHGERYDPAGRS
jgi:hypothetical protein